MTLAKEIEKFREEFLATAPADVIKTIQETTEQLIASGIAKKSLAVGDAVPAFSLPNAVGKTVGSGELLQQGNLVISFYRGLWCPYCSIQLPALLKIVPQIKELGAQLVAISPQTPDNTMATKEKYHLAFEVLSDVGNKVARQFGLVFALAEELRPLYKQFGIDIPAHNGDDSYELPMPATYVVDKSGKIVYAFVDADYTKRAEPADIVDVLKRTG